MKSSHSMQHTNPAIFHLSDMTMKIVTGARQRFGRLAGRGAALLTPRVVEPVIPEPQLQHDVEVETNPLKTGVAFYHPYADEDGPAGTHINIDSRAKTDMGKMLTHLYESKFVHPEFGPFQSMEGFWAYVRNNGSGNQFRTMHGMTARRASQKVKSRKIDFFYEIILEANFEKITQNTEGLADMLKESTLPFDHYYVFGPRGAELGADGHLIRPPVAEMMIKMMTEIRDHLKAGTRPPKPDYVDVSPRKAQTQRHIN